MKNQNILKIAVPSPVYELFDYLPPKGIDSKELSPGLRVRVPFGKRSLVGYVVQEAPSTLATHKLKAIEAVIDKQPLFPSKTWELLCKASKYYHHPLGEVITTGLPKAIKLGETVDQAISLSKQAYVEGKAENADITLSAQQQNAVEQLNASADQSSHSIYLLEGVTGSGKTEIYIRLLTKCLEQKTSALVLLPEIALTPQTLGVFEQRLDSRILVYHSKLTAKARLSVWQHVRDNPYSVVIGTRSSIFLPFPQLSTLIVDEEHDPSFKQQDGFRYSARDLAVLRGSLENALVVLGSATPSFESLLNASRDKYKHIQLTQRVNQGPLPQINLIDVRHKKLQGGLSAKLIDTISSHLKQNNQVLIFLNRRGYAPAYMCFDCGWLVSCSRCDAQMIVHHGQNKLICHHCDKTVSKMDVCQECQAPMSPVGIGTEKLEETLLEQFPKHTLLRIDSDSTRKKGALEQKLEAVQNQEAQLIIGTQLLAKGHHFPNVTLVAIVDVDSGLMSADFRAVERMGQLITQVAGRAGRASKPGEVVLQSHYPEHPLLQLLVQQGYPPFAKQLLLQRKNAQLPPFSHIVLIRAQAKNTDKPRDFLEIVKKELISYSKKVDVWGPISAIMSKKQGHYRFQLVLQANERKTLHPLLSQIHHIVQKNPLKGSVRWSLDVDPLEMR